MFGMNFDVNKRLLFSDPSIGREGGLCSVRGLNEKVPARTVTKTSLMCPVGTGRSFSSSPLNLSRLTSVVPQYGATGLLITRLDHSLSTSTDSSYPLF